MTMNMDANIDVSSQMLQHVFADHRSMTNITHHPSGSPNDDANNHNTHNNHNGNNSNDGDGFYPGYVSNELTRLIVTINYAFITTCICVFGIVANIINMVVFIKQGFNETINLSLFALTISDLSGLVTLLWTAICHNPLFVNADTALLTEEVQSITGAWPTVMFQRITGWLTAFLTVERCFCVLLPLKVKAIFTRTRSKVIIATIYVIVPAGMAPLFHSSKLGWKYVLGRNKTMLGIVEPHNWQILRGVSSILSGIVSSLGYSLVVITCTTILIVTLNRQRKWRQKASSAGKLDPRQQAKEGKGEEDLESKSTKSKSKAKEGEGEEELESKSTTCTTKSKSKAKEGEGEEESKTKSKSKSKSKGETKEKAVIKMVILIASILIVCLVVPSFMTIPWAIMPEFRLTGLYGNLLRLLGSSFIILSAINGSVNIFVYYDMSSNYRLVFRQTFFTTTSRDTNL